MVRHLVCGHPGHLVEGLAGVHHDALHLHLPPVQLHVPILCEQQPPAILHRAGGVLQLLFRYLVDLRKREQHQDVLFNAMQTDGQTETLICNPKQQYPTSAQMGCWEEGLVRTFRRCLSRSLNCSSSSIFSSVLSTASKNSSSPITECGPSCNRATVFIFFSCTKRCYVLFFTFFMVDYMKTTLNCPSHTLCYCW